MNVGDKIKINAKRESAQKITSEVFKVHSMHQKFCVLDNGKYRVCAFYGDLARREVIVI